jgi:uncharacterized RDD family membrane protein YckC
MSRVPARVVVTPEHVEIRLEPAGLGSRFLALVVDLAFVLGATTLVHRLTLGLPGGTGTLLRALLLLLLTWGYHVYFEVWHQGRSPGKRLAGIRVVDGRGLPLGLEQCFVRNVVRVLDALPIGYALGAVACHLDASHRRLGDVAADTLVVRERGVVDFDRRGRGPRSWNSLRTPRVLRAARHRVSLEEREFLSVLCLRAGGLDDRARHELMEDVGRHYRERLGIEEEHLPGESVVRGLAAALFSDRPGAAAPAGRRGAPAGPRRAVAGRKHLW